MSASSYEFISGNSRFASGGILLIVSGAVTSVIAGVGFVGACFKWRPLLVIVSCHNYVWVTCLVVMNMLI